MKFIMCGVLLHVLMTQCLCMSVEEIIEKTMVKSTHLRTNRDLPSSPIETFTCPPVSNMTINDCATVHHQINETSWQYCIDIKEGCCVASIHENGNEMLTDHAHQCMTTPLQFLHGNHSLVEEHDIRLNITMYCNDDIPIGSLADSYRVNGPGPYASTPMNDERFLIEAFINELETAYSGFCLDFNTGIVPGTVYYNHTLHTHQDGNLPQGSLGTPENVTRIVRLMSAIKNDVFPSTYSFYDFQMAVWKTVQPSLVVEDEVDAQGLSFLYTQENLDHVYQYMVNMNVGDAPLDEQQLCFGVVASAENVQQNVFCVPIVEWKPRQCDTNIVVDATRLQFPTLNSTLPSPCVSEGLIIKI